MNYKKILSASLICLSLTMTFFSSCNKPETEITTPPENNNNSNSNGNDSGNGSNNGNGNGNDSGNGSNNGNGNGNDNGNGNNNDNGNNGQGYTKGPQPLSYMIDGTKYDMVLVEGEGIRSFYIMQTELPPSAIITINGIEFGPLNKNNDVAVTKNEYKSFLLSIEEKTGWRFTLPTREEWTFAAKGGSKSKNYAYSGSYNIDKVAWYSGNSNNKMHPVAEKMPNELGLYDMSGNYGEVTYEENDGVDGDICGGNCKSSSSDCKCDSWITGNKNTGFISEYYNIRHSGAFDARIETVRLIYYKND